MSTAAASRPPSFLKTTLDYAQAVLFAIARDEALGRRPARLTEPGLATWRRFRGRLDVADLVRLLLEDAAVAQPLPFDSGRIAAHVPDSDGSLDLRQLKADRVQELLAGLAELDLSADPVSYITEQARHLRIGWRLARSDLHRLHAHHRAIELPGTGGQLAHYLAATQEDVHLQDVFTIVVADWRELLLAGLVCADHGLQGDPPVVFDPSLETFREAPPQIDYVLAADPSKQGTFEESVIRLRFPGARVLFA